MKKYTQFFIRSAISAPGSNKLSSSSSFFFLFKLNKQINFGQIAKSSATTATTNYTQFFICNLGRFIKKKQQQLKRNKRL